MNDVYERAKRLAALVETKAREAQVPVTFCVVDIHGNLVLKQRMPGASLVSLEMSERKAYTSAALGMRTSDVAPLALPGQPLYTLSSVAGGRFVAFGGGVPMRDGEVLIAGAGVSGGTVDQDVAIIEASLAELEAPASGAVRARRAAGQGKR